MLLFWCLPYVCWIPSRLCLAPIQKLILGDRFRYILSPLLRWQKAACHFTFSQLCSNYIVKDNANIMNSIISTPLFLSEIKVGVVYTFYLRIQVQPFLCQVLQSKKFICNKRWSEPRWRYTNLCAPCCYSTPKHNFIKQILMTVLVILLFLSLRLNTKLSEKVINK